LRLKRILVLAWVAILACFLAGVSSSYSAIIVSNVTIVPAHYLTVQPSVIVAEQVFTPKANVALSASSAPPPTEWNKTYGGTGDDWAGSVVQTSDGGFVMAGGTDSFGAGDYDFWLVKTDAEGNMEWNKTYGGTDIDTARSVIQTGDGGYAIAGQTMSFGAGGRDFWLVKTDAEGNMEWNKTYGGGEGDYLFSVVQTGDGGYALAGYTYSFGAGYDDLWLVKVAPFRDISVTHVSPSKTVAGQSYPVFINVTVQNRGDVTETFNITAYANETIIATLTDITLTSGSSTTLTFNWSTTSFAKGNYTIKAQATPVSYEADTTDNTLINGWVFVTLPGDVDRDKDVDIFDIVSMASVYDEVFPPVWPIPPPDIDGDGDVDIYDIVIAAENYGKSW